MLLFIAILLLQIWAYPTVSYPLSSHPMVSLLLQGKGACMEKGAARQSTTRLFSLFENLAETLNKRMDTIKNSIDKRGKGRAVKGEEDELYDILNEKPWRAGKVKSLKVHYRSCEESWKERFVSEGEDTIYLYATPDTRFGYESAKPDDLWNFPWMWSKTKAERMAWIQKMFNNEVETLSVQEHMELDAFYSEFDMPVRWGLLRLKEMDVLNVMALNLVFWTDFNGVKPTDLGLRPDGTVRTCPVQFHNCISTSNDPLDLEHYVKPLKWDRSKSPDQAYDEIKSIYFNYPKRGLRWTYGWIDRGGWKPQQFSGNYFYAQANSLSWQFTDDVEFVLDIDKREVQLRSSTRLGQIDWDVERLRYNQFVRMLEKKGGWEVEPVQKLRWLSTGPYRWTQIAVDKGLGAAEGGLNTVIGSVSENEDMDSVRAKIMTRYEQVVRYMQPYVQPLYDRWGEAVEGLGLDSLVYDPRVAAALQALRDLEAQIEDLLSSSSSSSSSPPLSSLSSLSSIEELVESYFNKIVHTLDTLNPISSSGSSSSSSSGSSSMSILEPTTTTQDTTASPSSSSSSSSSSPSSSDKVTDSESLGRVRGRVIDSESLGEDAKNVIKRLYLKKRDTSSSSSSLPIDISDIEFVIESKDN